MRLDDLRPGDIWFVDYWCQYDEVISIVPSPDRFTWVVVREVRRVGDSWEVIGPTRKHCTAIDRRDKVSRDGKQVN